MPIEPEPFDEGLPHRFFTLKQVAAILATSEAQVYALVRAGDLPAIKIGGRGQWRVENQKLDQWIEAQYVKTRRPVDEDLFDLDDVDHHGTPERQRMATSTAAARQLSSGASGTAPFAKASIQWTPASER